MADANLAGGFRRPETQVPLLKPDGYSWYFLDMGWTDAKVAAEYDGEQHRTDDRQYTGDVRRSEFIERRYRRVRIVRGSARRRVPTTRGCRAAAHL